jgi:6-phosphogluconate dehydrogenase
MKTNQCDIGLIGLAVMGENLVLNMESKGFQVAVFNRTTAVTEKFAAGRGKEKNIQPTDHDGGVCQAPLQRPRKAMIMVKAGAPVDSVISQLVPLLEKGDVVISTAAIHCFTDTQRRCQELEGRGNSFSSAAVFPAGEEGALKGPSLMPWRVARLVGHYRADLHQNRGASRWRALLPLHGTRMAPVTTVKMVHNGIEYGDMQLICEAYAILSSRARI